MGLSAINGRAEGSGSQPYARWKMDRTFVAYLLIALLVAAGVALAIYLRHNTRERVQKRERSRDRASRKIRSNP